VFGNRPGMRIPGMKIKQSTRWIDEFSSRCVREFNVPYIDKAGKDSIFTLAKWRCHPMQLVGSLVSTKFARIMSILRKRFRGKAKAFREIAFSAAAVSTITQSSWIIDRFLGVSRVFSKKRISHHIVQGAVRSLDDIQRFVYSQVCSQAYWLTSRSERPRDKSNDSRPIEYEDRLMLEDPDILCACNLYTCPYGHILAEVVYSGPVKSEGYHSATQDSEEYW